MKVGYWNTLEEIVLCTGVVYSLRILNECCGNQTHLIPGRRWILKIHHFCDLIRWRFGNVHIFYVYSVRLCLRNQIIMFAKANQYVCGTKSFCTRNCINRLIQSEYVEMQFTMIIKSSANYLRVLKTFNLKLSTEAMVNRWFTRFA